MLHKHLSLAGLADLLLDKTEIVSLGFALRAGGKHDSFVARHVRPP
jgi:hypothetical protein